MTRAVFLPGAGGRRAFWRPVAERLAGDVDPVLLAWPGFGDEPFDPRLRGLDDLADYVTERIAAPVDVIAQSMGGVVALLAAARRPDLIRRLVLCGASGGFDLLSLGAEDWRDFYEDEGMPERLPRWFLDDQTDLRPLLPSVRIPTLLLWGERDEISPVAAGEYLRDRLPDARLEVVAGGGHSFPVEQPDATAAAIGAFLRQTQPAYGAARRT